MPHYVSLMRWTSQGLAGLPGWRERVEEGERTIKEAGGRLVGVYVTLGRYDVVEIFEAPDDEVAVEILMKLQRYGAEHTETLRGFTREEAEEIVRIGVERLSRRRAVVSAGGGVRVGPHPHAVELLEYYARSLAVLEPGAGAEPLPAASAR